LRSPHFQKKKKNKEDKEGVDPLNCQFDDSCGKGGSSNEADMSYWTIFWKGLAGGFIALLMPCIFPIIPLTVSFFTKQEKSKALSQSILYGISIIVIYVTLGFLLTRFFGPEVLHQMSINIWFNLSFFVIFVVFAISFFGAFEMALPSSWLNKADSMSDSGGMIGIFFMAFTLVLVSFSCTGPIIGTLLVDAAIQGGTTGPLVGMFGFALALALPFTLFAMFPSWLKSLPRSGGWLNELKVSLGFLELALALKFLSNVDLVYHWGILPRPLFLAICAIILGLMTAYIFGVHRMFDKERRHKFSVPRWTIGLISLVFTVYLATGVWGAPLKMISGFPPPMSTDCPLNIDCFHDLDEGLAHAKEVGKPVMIDFTGWACPNCRRMEANAWSEPDILPIISNDYVLISLYVDDSEALPKEEQVYSEVHKRKMMNVGEKWSDLEVTKYGRSSQPWYVLLDNDGNLLACPVGYTEKDKYKAFLKEGLCRYEMDK